MTTTPRPVAAAFGVFWTAPDGRVVPCEAYKVDAAGNVTSGDAEGYDAIATAYERGQPFKTYEGFVSRADAIRSVWRTRSADYSVRPLPAGTLFHLDDFAETLAIVAPLHPFAR